MKTSLGMNQDQISIGDATSIVVITELPFWTHKTVLRYTQYKIKYEGKYSND